MFGTVTLAIVIFSTATKLASASTMPATQSIVPFRVDSFLRVIGTLDMASP